MNVSQPDHNVGTPISKLNNDLLFEIFYMNASIEIPDRYFTDPTVLNPLVLTRQASHVCREWNAIILQSSTIWGRCFNLDALLQESDTWRNLVLERTGQSFLYVTGRGNMRPGFRGSNGGPEKFLLQLLQEHWTRIREFDVMLESYHPHWRYILPHIIKSFSRPTENLRKFAISIGLEGIPDTGPRPQKNFFDPTFRFFSNHAPSLVHLSIKTQSIPVHFTENFIISTNMRHLYLRHHALEITDIDLLSVFARLPQLEDVEMTIYKLNIKNPSGTSNLPRPSLPRLKRFWLVSMDVSVYPAFLDKIDPGWDCQFQFKHHIHTWTTTTSGEKTWPEMAHLGRVVERYAYHLSTRQMSRSPDVVDIDLEFCGDYRLYFSCCQRGLVIDLEIYDDSETVRQVVIEKLCDTLVALNLPNPVNQLELHLSTYFLTKYPAVIQGLKVLHFVTNLIVTSDEIPYICTIPGPSAEVSVFPLLNTLSVSSSESRKSRGKIYKAATQFIRDRQKAAVPIHSLVFLESEHFHGSKEDPARKPDVHAFDHLAGLKVVWFQSGNRYEHVCSDVD